MKKVRVWEVFPISVGGKKHYHYIVGARDEENIDYIDYEEIVFSSKSKAKSFADDLNNIEMKYSEEDEIDNE